VDGASSQGWEAATALAVAQVTYTAAALDDIERLFVFLAKHDLNSANAAVSAIRDAVSILSRHPLIGRETDGPLRQLVISFGTTGYLALYRFRPERDEIRILALRHQRELDYRA